MVLYDLEELKQEALAAGFTHAGPLNTAALVFMPEVRDMCRADRCRSYGKNWRCPPACGSIEEAAEQASRYGFGLLLQTVGQMEDDFDIDAIEGTSQRHQESFKRLLKLLRARYEDFLPMGAGACRLCPVCTCPDAPCRFPELAVSSMEAYGLWVSKVCQLSGQPYYYGRHTITYTSCYLLP